MDESYLRSLYIKAIKWASLMLKWAPPPPNADADAVCFSLLTLKTEDDAQIAPSSCCLTEGPLVSVGSCDVSAKKSDDGENRSLVYIESVKCCLFRRGQIPSNLWNREAESVWMLKEIYNKSRNPRLMGQMCPVHGKSGPRDQGLTKTYRSKGWL